MGWEGAGSSSGMALLYSLQGAPGEEEEKEEEEKEEEEKEEGSGRCRVLLSLPCSTLHSPNRTAPTPSSGSASTMDLGFRV